MKNAMRSAVLVLVIALLLSCFAVYLVYKDRQAQVSLSQTGANTTPDTSSKTTAPGETESATQGPTVPTTEQTIPPTTTEPPPEITALQAVVAHTSTGQVFYRQDSGYEKVYPASVTKLFTAYIALQYLSPDQAITAGDELDFVAADASVAYILKGHRLSTTMLVEGLLLCSGNDAAYILATAAGREIAGDPGLPVSQAVQVFVDEMNRQAQELGLTDTHFMNPDGYHVGGHYTSLEDLVQIGKLALDTPAIAECVAVRHKDMVFLSGETIYWRNTNLLLDPESEFYMPSACGLKTGHTDQGGYCLLSAFRQGDGFLIVGVFGCPTSDDRFADTVSLAEHFG